MIAGQVDPALFPSISGRLLGICLAYFSTYSEAPKDHFHDELARVCEKLDDKDVDALVRYAERVRDMAKPQSAYIIRRVNDFVKERSLQSALIEASESLGDGQFPKAENILHDALRAGIQREEIGIDYFHDFSNLDGRGDAPNYLMSTGVAGLDKLIGGYGRGELGCLLGGYKGMKTWGLQHIGRQGLLEGLKVAHFSHENSAEQTELRYDMMFSSRSSLRKWIGKVIEYPMFDETTHRLKRVKVKVPSVYDHAAVLKARKNLQKRGGDLLIKKYPMGTCSVEEIKRYLNYLESFHDWTPDVVITDYADVMKHHNERDQTRDQINDTYIRLKGLADDRQILVVTASQVQRSALQHKILKMQHVAEDIRKIGNVDWALGICRTEDDVKSGCGRLAVIASRNDVQDVYCGFSPCTILGQFCMSSWVSDEISEKVYSIFGPKKKEKDDE